MERGPVDLMIERWERERPDLDASSLAIIALRVTRLARAIDDDAAAALRESFNLSDVEFQLLAAIRTAPDCRAAPRTLLQPLMVTSGGLTNRIDRLESAGFLVRAPNPDDRRGVFLELTPRGRELVDRVTAAYRVQNHAEGVVDLLRVAVRSRAACVRRAGERWRRRAVDRARMRRSAGPTGVLAAAARRRARA